MKKKYDIVATSGSYQKDGETKYINKNVGAVFVDDNGKPKIKLDPMFNPAGVMRSSDGSAWLACFPPRDPQQAPQQQNYQAPQQQAPQQTQNDFNNDEIPF